MHARLEVGGEIGGYAVKDRLGEGGMGTVFLAEQRETGELVALKILQAELAQDPEFRRRFERESQYASSLNHPNITRLIEFGEADGVEFMAMEYVPGHDLTVELAAGRLATGRTLEILEQVASALDAVHSSGLFHRDVKPANILVNDDEGTGPPRCWLTDFGLSKHPSQDSSPLTNAGFFVGTCQYVAPEQILADRDLDHRVDVYSLGCVLYECLAGDPPFMRPREEQVLYAHIQDPPPKLSQVRPDLPAEVDAVLDRALAEEAGGALRQLRRAHGGGSRGAAGGRGRGAAASACAGIHRLPAAARDGRQRGGKRDPGPRRVRDRAAGVRGGAARTGRGDLPAARADRAVERHLHDRGPRLDQRHLRERPADLEARSCSPPATGSRWARPRSWCRSASRPRRPPPLRTRTPAPRPT